MNKYSYEVNFNQSLDEANKEQKKKTLITITKNQKQDAFPPIFFTKNGTTQDFNFIAYKRQSLCILFTSKKGSKTKWY